MSKTLNPRRKLTSPRNWSPNISSLLETSVKYDEIIHSISSNNSESTKPKPMENRDSYTSSKRALELKLRKRADTYHQCSKNFEKTKHFQKPVSKLYQQRCTEPSKLKDNHIIETVIEERKHINSQFNDTSQNSTHNLKTSRRLPRDKDFFVKTTNRIFYWG